MTFFFEIAQAVAALPAARDLREAVRGGRARRLPRRRLRAGARLPSPRALGCRRDPRRPAEDQGRPLPRRGRHAARGAADADGRRAADAVQGDQIRALMARNMGLVRGSCRGTGSSRRRRRNGSGTAARRWRPGTRKASSCPRTRSIRRKACRSGRRPTPSIAARRRTTIRPPTRSSRPSIRVSSSRWILR